MQEVPHDREIQATEEYPSSDVACDGWLVRFYCCIPNYVHCKKIIVTQGKRSKIEVSLFLAKKLFLSKPFLKATYNQLITLGCILK